MSNFWKTFGHLGVKALLEKHLTAKKFSHAYLFKGPQGIGKNSLAEEFAQQLLNTSSLASHPDFVRLNGEASVEEVRKLIGRLSAKPFSASHSVAIIDDAQKLSVSASNALLKTLEEPSPAAIIILVSSREVLPTMTSRCLNLSFNLFTIEECRAFAEAQGLELEPESYMLAGGRVGVLRNFSADPEGFREFKGTINRLETILAGNSADKLLGIQVFAEMDEDRLAELLHAYIYWLKASLSVHPGNFRLIEAVLFALRQLRTNMNKKFILHKLLLG